MTRAIWKGRVIAEAAAGRVEQLEGSIYFPPDTVHLELLQPSDRRTFCSWKGAARFYHLAVDGTMSRDAAWSYPTPTSTAAHRIAGYVAFGDGVQVEP